MYVYSALSKLAISHYNRGTLHSYCLQHIFTSFPALCLGMVSTQTCVMQFGDQIPY